MAKVHDFVEMWQGSQNLRATQRESRAENKQMTSLGYISDTEESFKASWSHFQHDGAAAFNFATSFVCKGPHWKTNSDLQCPPNPENQPSSSRKS